MFDIAFFKKHVSSFLKTYITALVTIAYFADQSGTDILTISFAIAAAKASVIVVIRNVYKLITEDAVVYADPAKKEEIN